MCMNRDYELPGPSAVHTVRGAPFEENGRKTQRGSRSPQTSTLGALEKTSNDPDTVFKSLYQHFQCFFVFSLLYMFVFNLIFDFIKDELQ